MPERDAEEILKRFRSLQGERKNWDDHWQEIGERVWPDADDFNVRRSSGERRSQKIFDATAALALEKFAAAVESLLTPRSQKWHRLRPSNDELNKDASVKQWFEDVNNVLFRVRNSARAAYYSQKHEGYKSLGAFGTATMFVDEFTDGGVRFKNCHLSQVYIEVDHHRNVDTVYRLYEMTAKAAEQRFGERLGDQVRTSLDVNPWKTFEFLHCVMPNPNRNPERKDAAGMAFTSLYLSVDEKIILEEGGYHEMPYLVSRYTVNPREVYGRSPAMLVLPSIRMAQEMQKTFIRAGHKIVDPPLLVADDGVLGAGSSAIRLMPGGINYGALSSDGRPLIAPLQTGARLDLTEGMLEKEREVINDAFLVSLFQILVERPQMTATEALIRAQEKGQLIAPTIGRQQSESLGPEIVRMVNILDRQGLLPERPGALLEAEGEYDIEYESPSSRFQRSEELVGIQRTMEILTPFAMADPTVMDIFKPEEVARISVEVTGAPQMVLRTPEELAELRKARAEAEERQRQMMETREMAAAAKDVAGAAAQVPQGTQPVA